MKITLVFLLAAVCAINAFPDKTRTGGVLAVESEDNNGGEHSRVKRFTCDVLSIEAKGVKVNDAACGAHCLLLGKTGGYCNGQRVCICR